MSTIKLNLSIEETNLILEALGSMPYVKVFELVGKIQQQAQQQLNQNGQADEAKNESFQKNTKS